jgi:hypothetical protein
MKVRHLFATLTHVIAAIMTAAPSITSAFPLTELTRIGTDTEPPNYASLRIAQTQLNSCAASVDSNGGDGVHGHLALTITPAEYIALSVGGVPFVAPLNPPIQPVHQQGATAAQIAENIRQHKEAKIIFRTYHDTDKVLRNMLIAKVDVIYIKALYDATVGFGNVTCLELLQHLKTNYGIIKQEELEENTKRMNTPWNPPTPIEALFDQLDEGVIFATAGGEPPAPSTVVRMGYNIIEVTGLFVTPCTEWRKLATAAKTMAAFKTHFREADVDRRLTTTTGSAGFHSANKATVTTMPKEKSDTVVADNAPLSYCWTHGSSKNVKHTSKTCENKAEGHDDDATMKDKKGGSTKVWGPKPK